MSLLDQAKKEAKRLFNLTKINPSSSQLNIENLSRAREIVSVINGYKNWHEYEEVLKRKDILFNKIDKNKEYKTTKKIEQNQSYYIQDLPFNTITSSIIKNTQLVIDKLHQPIILGRNKEKSLFETKEKKWILNDYPLLITGSTGSGLSEILCTMAYQYIKNNEGVIYVDGKGESVTYTKFYAIALETNRTDDLYCINLMINSRDVFGPQPNSEDPQSRGHSIDPINPMVNCPEYFNQFFGRIGIIIHAILQEIHQKNQWMDIESLESILMLNNLIDWYRNKTFKSNEIAEYLIDLGLSLNEENDEEDFDQALKKHAQLSYQAYQIIDGLKKYPNTFRLDCCINMEKVFLERKILLVLAPALEKSTDELANIVKVIVYQIKYMEEKYAQYKTHFQNIILNDFDYYANHFKETHIKSSPNNYIFAQQGYNDYNDISQYVLNNVNTTVWMKSYNHDLPNKIKLELIENLNEFPKLKTSNNNKISFLKNFYLELMELQAGQAYVLNNNTKENSDETVINNKTKYYVEYINCEYKNSKPPQIIKLTRYPVPIIYKQY